MAFSKLHNQSTSATKMELIAAQASNQKKHAMQGKGEWFRILPAHSILTSTTFGRFFYLFGTIGSLNICIQAKITELSRDLRGWQKSCSEINLIFLNIVEAGQVVRLSTVWEFGAELLCFYVQAWSTFDSEIERPDGSQDANAFQRFEDLIWHMPPRILASLT